MSPHHLGVLARHLGLQLNEGTVQELGNPRSLSLSPHLRPRPLSDRSRRPPTGLSIRWRERHGAWSFYPTEARSFTPTMLGPESEHSCFRIDSTIAL